MLGEAVVGLGELEEGDAACAEGKGESGLIAEGKVKGLENGADAFFPKGLQEANDGGVERIGKGGAHGNPSVIGTVVVGGGVVGITQGRVQEERVWNDEAALNGDGIKEGLEHAACTALGAGGINLAAIGVVKVERAEVDNGFVGGVTVKDYTRAVIHMGKPCLLLAKSREGMGLPNGMDGVARLEGVEVFVGLGNALEVGGLGIVSATHPCGCEEVLGFGFAQHLAAHHHLEKTTLAFACGGEVAIEAKGVGALGEAAEKGGLGKGEVTRGGVEIITGGGFKSGDFSTVRRVIKVGGEDFGLTVEALHLTCTGRLKKFMPERTPPPGGERNHLHADGGGA